jgi:putative SOS response-associated peptidase YedK
MCARYPLHGPHSRLREQFGLTDVPELADRYNIAPSTDIVVVRLERRAKVLRWGLKKNGTVANIRDDSTDKPWARSLLAQRCVLPASGFYEWQKPAERRRRKQPFYVTPSGDGPYFAIAGAVGFWEGIGATLFTTTANEPMKAIHERMPVLLDAAGVDAWLDPETPLARLLELLRPAPDEQVRARRVSLAVTSSRNEGAKLINSL